MMEPEKIDVAEIQSLIEQRFKDLGGFTWEDAEKWAGFCNAVGMDPIPFLKVILTNVCEIKSVYHQEHIPSCSACPELWVTFRGDRTKMKLVMPKE